MYCKCFMGVDRKQRNYKTAKLENSFKQKESMINQLRGQGQGQTYSELRR